MKHFTIPGWSISSCLVVKENVLVLLHNNQRVLLSVSLLLPRPVVLPGGVCGVRYLASECGRRLGALVHVGGVQQDLWGRCILLHEALWQPSVSRQSKPQQAEHTHPGPAYRCVFVWVCSVCGCRGSLKKSGGEMFLLPWGNQRSSFKALCGCLKEQSTQKYLTSLHQYHNLS